MLREYNYEFGVPLPAATICAAKGTSLSLLGFMSSGQGAELLVCTLAPFFALAPPPLGRDTRIKRAVGTLLETTSVNCLMKLSTGSFIAHVCNDVLQVLKRLPRYGPAESNSIVSLFPALLQRRAEQNLCNLPFLLGRAQPSLPYRYFSLASCP